MTDAANTSTATAAPVAPVPESVVVRSPVEAGTAAEPSIPSQPAPDPDRRTVFRTRDLNVYYSQFRAVRDVTFDV